MTKKKEPQTPRNNPYTSFFELKSFWVLLIGALLAIPLILSFKRPPVKEIPVYSQLQEFSLTNQDNREITNREFYGSVVIANLIFTRCPSICPMMTAQMKKIQGRLKGVAKTIQLLSLSVDPKHDTPEVLKDYAQKYQADLKLWTFLTGDLEQITQLAYNSFKLALEHPEDYSSSNKYDAVMDITHGEHFILIDQIGNIRGFNKVQNDKDINELIRDVTILVNQSPPPLPEKLKTESLGR